MKSVHGLLAVAVVVCGVAAGSAQQLKSSHEPVLKVPGNVPAVAPDKPIARVNGVAIPQRAFQQEVQRIFPYAGMHNNRVPKEYEAQIRQQALANLVNTELVYQEAKRRNLQITEQEWQQRLAEVRKEYQSAAEFAADIQRLFGSRAAFEAKLRHDMLLDKLYLTEVKHRAAVSDADLQQYYSANRAHYVQPESVSFQTISAMFPKDASAADKQAARQRIDQVLAKASAAKSFQQFGLLAEKYSEDDYRVAMGDHQMVHRGSMELKEFDAVFAMKVGETRVIPSSAAYTIVRLNKHLPGRQLSFAEVRSSIRQQLETERLNARNKAFHESLRKRAKVEIL